MNRVPPILLATCLVFLVAACGGGDGGQGQTGSTRCNVGEKKACACTNGDTGFKLCNSDEHWDACSCTGTPDPDVAGDDDVTSGNDDVTSGDHDSLGDDDAILDDDLVCHPACGGKECGPDGCGGTCGTCGTGETCDPSYTCQPGVCVPDCAGRECGPDGCTGTCGTCDASEVCDVTAHCVPGACQPQCSGKQCGDNGCGGSCGSCPNGSQCDAGTCESTCQPACSGKVCGSDGCSGSCGSCASGKTCQAGQCVATNQIDCLQLYADCFPTCSDGDQACAETCYNTLSPTGKTETDAFMSCMQTNACYDAADINDCVFSKCFGEYLGCFHGDDACPQVASCLDGCGSSNTTCWGDCLADGTTDVQISYYNAADQCLINLCCPNDSAVCNQTEGQACIQTALAPGGDCVWPAIPCP